MQVASRVVFPLVTVVAITAIGTIGYVLVEDLSLLDALYMTIITLSTVGFGEVTELSTTGKLFTSFLIVTGIGAASYSVLSIASFFIEGSLREVLGRRTRMKSIEGLERHVILCGFGRLGKVVAAEVAEHDLPVVVVEQDEGRQRALEASGLPFIIGSALDDQVLLTAGLMRARAIVLAVQDEADNVFITLSVRELCPELAIHARAETDTGIRRLQLAGATQVISPFHVGGLRIAQKIVRPALVDFVELFRSGAGADMQLEEVELMEGCKLHSMRLSELKNEEIHGLVVAIRSPNQKTKMRPGASERMHAGDRVVVIGDSESLVRMANLAAVDSQV